MAYSFGNWLSSNPLTGQIADWIAPDWTAQKRLEGQNNNINPNNQGYAKAGEQYGKYIDSNTGDKGYNKGYDTAKKNSDGIAQGIQSFRNGASTSGANQDYNLGTSQYNQNLANAKKGSAGIAENLTAKQANGASAQALGNAISSGMTRGRAAMDSGNAGANAYTNAYANNYNTQLGQQNALMGQMNNQQQLASNSRQNYSNMAAQDYGTQLGQLNTQQGVYNQGLMNQLNAQGTKMGADLTNDQAQFQQQTKNQEVAENRNARNKKGLFGWVKDIFSDEELKTNKAKVGIGGDEDLRLIHYRNTCEKLKHMNPNKWEELKWKGDK